VKTFRLLLVGVAVALVLAGCGGSGSDSSGETAPPTSEPQENLRKLQLSMEGYAAPSDAGILLAERLGYFADAGVNLTIIGAIRPEYSIDYAADGASDVVVTQMPEVIRANAEGEQVVAIGSVLTEPAVAMIWLPESGIGGVADLKGKTVAIPGAIYQQDFLEYVLEGAGLTLGDVNLKVVRHNSVQALTSGRADAAFGASWNADGAALESRGLNRWSLRRRNSGFPLTKNSS
jgi:putative hydroxymethylpyrimidine transport system substrate-binding protein